MFILLYFTLVLFSFFVMKKQINIYIFLFSNYKTISILQIRNKMKHFIQTKYPSTVYIMHYLHPSNNQFLNLRVSFVI